ncbi:ABC transporter [Streptomyces sp. Amel2xE9]|uniref:ABC transporter n=1 Tax=unclassified Streptomyces TaxID=2593676 RepID=UPI0003A442C0|nr:ABC transporter [Streptomyces sp. Amel2xE9]
MGTAGPRETAHAGTAGPREAARAMAGAAGPGEAEDASAGAAGPREAGDALGNTALPREAGDATAGTAGPREAGDAPGSTAGPREGAGAPKGTALSWALVRVVWRVLPWRVLGAAGVLGAAMAAGTRLTGREPDAMTGLLVLRLAALVGGLALAFLFDDPARRTTEAVPVRRPVWAGLRLTLVAPLAAVWWTAVLFLVPAAARPPAGAVTLEAAAIGVTAVALAAASVRLRSEPDPGAGAALTLLALAVAVLLLPSRWNLLVPPGDPNWAEAHRWWAGLLVAAALLCAAGLPEPLHRLRYTPRGRRTPGPGVPPAYGA